MAVFDYLLSFLESSWETLREMSPYLLFGFFVAGLLSVLVKPESVERHLGGRGFLQIIKAALFGVPLPLCSCGVIPVSASLRKHGASTGATTSFLISTPQTGADSILVTLSLLGPVFAVVRPLVSFFSGLIGGTLVLFFGEKGSGRGEKRPVCHAECCTGQGEKRSSFIQVFRYGFRTLPEDLYRALIIGIIIAGIISAIIPDDYFAPILGGGILSLIILMAAGIPVYVCATASVPIAAALIAKGVSPGAALVFLMTGPATNAATISTVWKIMGRRTALIYLGTVAASALAAGLLIDHLILAGGTEVSSSMPWMIPGQVKSACAFILLGVLIMAATSKPDHGHEAEGDRGRRIRINISGMTCHHCAASVRRALLEHEGIENVTVDHRNGTAFITGSGFDEDELKRIVEDAGYGFNGIDDAE